ncbi:hypothetical protein PIB30_030151 [Stylosanthes scabra]|uniref:Uncharacterized protein n=1 Tax=Stylosanthes scabra TaxID=79078 RepID=A0ABU6QB12_9FABA|nr:hypothetical protein [Stylosanthes scabra]
MCGGLPTFFMCDDREEDDKSFAWPQIVRQSELWIKSYRDRKLAWLAEELIWTSSGTNSPPALSFISKVYVFALQETLSLPGDLPADFGADVTGGFWDEFTGGIYFLVEVEKHYRRNF